MAFKYPTPEEVIEFNKILLKEIKVKKADKPELLSYTSLVACIDSCERLKGDIHDKATCLLKNLVQKHPFASGNRRTAFAVTERFLTDNNFKSKIINTEVNANTLKGIRYDFYSNEEIKNWLKTGKIRKMN